MASLRELSEKNRTFDVVYTSSDANGQVEYAGYAAAGTDPSAAGWAIAKLTYDASSNPTKKWANGSPAYVHIWDSRALYTYS